MISAPRFDWSFNFGHVLQLFGMAAAVGGGLWWTSAKFENLDGRISAAENRAILWTPRVEAIMKSDELQNERMQNIATAIRDNREDNKKVVEKLSLLGEDMAAIKARLSIPARN